MNNFLWPYLLVNLHFLSGALWIGVINRKLDPGSSRKQWMKYLTYVVLFNLIWLSVIWAPSFFVLLASILILAGAWEWWRTISISRGRMWFLAGFLLIAWGFGGFLQMTKADILFAYFVIILFDGSSQIAGQVTGRHSLLPNISPGKTVEGLVGGTLITLGSLVLVRNSFAMDWLELFAKGLLIMTFAFFGDLAASFVKRRANQATFGTWLPGHGGFLDRFDSLFFTGFMIFICSFLKAICL